MRLLFYIWLVYPSTQASASAACQQFPTLVLRSLLLPQGAAYLYEHYVWPVLRQAEGQQARGAAAAPPGAATLHPDVAPVIERASRFMQTTAQKRRGDVIGTSTNGSLSGN